MSSGHQERQLRSVLLVAEIGLSVVLLTGAGLLIRSFVNALRIDAGFDPRHRADVAQLQGPDAKAEKLCTTSSAPLASSPRRASGGDLQRTSAANHRSQHRDPARRRATASTRGVDNLARHKR